MSDDPARDSLQLIVALLCAQSAMLLGLIDSEAITKDDALRFLSQIPESNAIPQISTVKAALIESVQSGRLLQVHKFVN
jgi:hypothetical protein